MLTKIYQATNMTLAREELLAGSTFADRVVDEAEQAASGISDPQVQLALSELRGTRRQAS